jgi:hypothetical protein
MAETVECYGLPFPADWPAWQIELACMTNDHPVSRGGLGKHGHLRNAMMLLWPDLYHGEQEKGVPKWRDEIELMTWAWCKYRKISVIGHASAAKTHTFGHIAVAEYLADAANTIVTLTSTHLPGLRKRLWSDVVHAALNSQAGAVLDIRHYDMSIRPTGLKEDKYVIGGISTDKGQEAVEKIQGNHSRLHNFVIIDEAQGTPKAIFDAAANLMTDADFRWAQLANPTKKFSEFGTWCEPTGGWGVIDPEVDIHWETKRGGICIRLDGARSPNIRHGRTIFPFLIRQDYVDSLEKSFGRESARWWTFYRGWFAPDGALGLVIPSSLIHRSEKPHVYNFRPTRIASVDPAFEGGDQCILSIAEFNDEFKMNLILQMPIKVAVKEDGDPLDWQIAMEIKRICKEHSVVPDNCIVDTTGAGRSVAAFLDREWGKVQRCGFGGKPTDRRLKDGESDTCEDLFDRFVSELWWSARVWMEEGMVGGIDSKFEELRMDLHAREYETSGDKKISVEKKKDMKDRIGRSPDHGDSFVMLVELLRRKGGIAAKGVKRAQGHPLERQMERARRYSELLENPNKEFSHGTL